MIKGLIIYYSTHFKHGIIKDTKEKDYMFSKKSLENNCDKFITKEKLENRTLNVVFELKEFINNVRTAKNIKELND